MRTFLLLASFLLVLSTTVVNSKPEGPIAPLSPSEEKINRCGLHHVVLRTGEVPIIYGMCVRDNDYEIARQRTFPRAQTHTFGGCVVERAVMVSRTGGVLSIRHSPRRQTVKFCPLCRVAEKSWLRSHKHGSEWSKPIESIPTIVLPKRR